MNLQRCTNGHFYDAEKYASCPFCSGGAAAPMGGSVTEADVGMQTIPEMPAESVAPIQVGDSLNTVLETIPGAAPTEPDMPIVREQPTDEMKTISYFDNAIGKDPVVGWLICIEGTHFGEDFRLKTGRNCIGRTGDMDVVLSGEKSVSRGKHSVVVYEPKANKFFIQPGESTELAYLNDDVILQVMPLNAYDVITLGDVKLMFVPFCSDKFQWDTVKKEDEKKDGEKEA